MKSLIWKEFHENLKWGVLALLVVGGLVRLTLRNPDLESIMSPRFLAITTVIGAAFAILLGFVQFWFESHGDRRAFLLHRPIRPTRIFLTKSLTGLGLYGLALTVPFIWAATWAATPGNVGAPFRWPMMLPGLADILAGSAYYFAGALTAQREARWYGSRGLGLVAAIFCSLCVWLLPEFRHAVVMIAIVSSLLGVAAWGSFLGGGSYSFTPRWGKLALAATFLVALVGAGVSAQTLVEVWMEPSDRTWQILGPHGDVWVVHNNEQGEMTVTDLAGQTPSELRGREIDNHLVRMEQVPRAMLANGPRVHWYRFPDRMFLAMSKTHSPGERWFYVFDQKRLVGYDLKFKRPIGSLGPDGFNAAVDGGPSPSRFEGELHYFRGYVIAGIRTEKLLAFTDHAYVVDYAGRTVKAVYTPAAQQTILAADEREDSVDKFPAFVLTEQGVQAIDENGACLFSAPLLFDRHEYRLEAAHLQDAQRYAVWYLPNDMGTDLISVGKLATMFLKHVFVKHWPLPGKTNEAAPSYLVEFDADGNELGRQTVPPASAPPDRPARALYGLLTPPAAYVLYAGADRMYARAGSSHEASALLFWFALSMTVSAAASAVACYVLARRYAFSRIRRVVWILCGLLAGPYGLLLMLSLEEWPARVRCLGCSRPRVIIRDACEHCGATHAAPVPDGTEIFETTTEGGVAIRPRFPSFSTLL